jgi:hypothetical protein
LLLLLDAEQRLGFVPELLELVALALGGRKQVDDDVPKVDQHPAAFSLALNTRGLEPVLFARRLAHALSQSLELAITGAGGDDEIVGERTQGLDIEQDDVFGLFSFQGVNE